MAVVARIVGLHINTAASEGKISRVMLQVHLVFILSSSKNDVTIKITIGLVIDHY